MSLNQQEDIQLISQTPGRLEFRSSGATAGLFLIIFSLLWGGIPTGFLISSLAAGRFEGPMAVILIFTIVGLGMLAGGIALLFSHTTIAIDGNRRAIFIARKSITSEQKEEHSFKEIKEVLYGTEIRHRSKGGSYSVWCVDLLDERGDALRLGAQTSEEAMRARAEILAKYLRIPMRDTTTGEDNVRMPDELDRTLAESMKLAGETPSVSSSPPEGSKLVVERAPRFVRYILPALGFTASSGCSGVFMLIWTGFACLWTFGAFAAVLSTHHQGPDLLFPLFGLPFILIGFFTFLPIVGGIVGRDELIITPETVKIARMIGTWRTGAREIPLRKVEEVTGGSLPLPLPSALNGQRLSPAVSSMISLVAPGSRPMRIVSDQAILRVGAGLSSSDSAWLYDSIRAEISRYGGK
jgi:hypothetical protein